MIECAPTVQIMYRKEYHIHLSFVYIAFKIFTYFTHFYFKIFPCSYFLQSMSVVYCSAVNVQCSAVYLLRWSWAQCMSRYRTLALYMLTLRAMLETLFWFSYAQKDFLVIRLPSTAIVITITSSQTKITLHKALLSTNPICIPEKV